MKVTMATELTPSVLQVWSIHSGLWPRADPSGIERATIPQDAGGVSSGEVLYGEGSSVAQAHQLNSSKGMGWDV